MLVQQCGFSCKLLRMIAGIGYVCPFNNSIKSPQFVEFLKVLQIKTGKKLLIIWDGLQPSARSSCVFTVGAQRGHIVRERLPAYTPDVKSVEYILGLLHASCHAQPLRLEFHRPRAACSQVPAADATHRHVCDRVLNPGGHAGMWLRTYENSMNGTR